MQYTEDNIRLIMGLKIRNLRDERRITLSELSDKTGISVSYLNEIEKGKKHPKPSKTAAIADALGTTYDKLVSLQMDKRLEPIAQLLASNLLHELQLDHFGIEPAAMVEHFSAAPDKLSAFISTIAEIARQYDLTLGSFYLTTLRTYQEMHFNYFPDLEHAAEQLVTRFPQLATHSDSTTLIQLLENEFKIVVSHNLDSQIGLGSLRSLMLPKQKKLLLNGQLTEEQKRFVAARELGFLVLDLKERPLSSAWVKIKSFEEVLNNFKASYFAGALLLPQDYMVEALSTLFKSSTWQPEMLESLISTAGVSPEMYLHRSTSILPKFFGIRHLFFLKFEHDLVANAIELVKELHISGLHNPHAKSTREHYCGRWISITLLEELALQQNDGLSPKWVTGLQRSQYAGSNSQYLVLSMARSFHPAPKRNSSISIGMLVNEEVKQSIHFLQDPAISSKVVSNTCERCIVQACEARKAPPYVLQQLQRQEMLEKALADAIQFQ